MSAIDDEIVTMQFNNSSFERGVSTSLSSIQRLKNALSFKKDSGLGDLQNQANRFNMNNAAGQIGKVTHGLNLMRVAGLVAFGTIVRQGVYAGEHLAAAFTIDPIKEGFKSYTDQINATQVILANTKAQGTKLKDVTATLKELQDYANLTVYSFSDMTTNIGRFTAAGVPLQAATDAIKGMANVAALSGANTQQMSSAMYQMSQALSTGTIRLQDWNSLSNANMAGTNIQKALEATARTMGDNGKQMDAAIKKNGSFRQSLQAGWLTADIYSKTMKIMGGTIDKSTGKMHAFSVEQIKQMGYSEKDAKSLHELSQSALDSAVKIRTLPQMMQALKEEVASAWGNIFKTIFGNINQATSLFTKLHNILYTFLTAPLVSLNKLLQGFVALGGKDVVIDIIVNSFHALGNILKPIGQAFREVFPAQTPQGLLNLAKGIRTFTDGLALSSQAMDGLKRTFAGVFAAIDIVWQVIKGVIGVLFSLVHAASGAGGGILGFTGSIGDFLVAIDRAIKHGGLLNGFFAGLTAVLRIPIHLFAAVAHAIGSLFKGWHPGDAKGITDSVHGITHGLGALQGAGAGIHHAFSVISTGIGRLATFLGGIGAKIGAALGGIGGQITKALQSQNFNQVLKILNTALFAGALYLVRKFLRDGASLTATLDVGGGMFSNIKKAFGELTSTLKVMQTQIQAKTLRTIAEAIALLTASVVALSFIDAKKLAKSLSAMTVAFGQLLGAMAILVKISGSGSFITLPATAASMVLLAGSLLILTAAVAVMSRLSWSSIIKGLAGVGGAMVVLSLGMKMISAVPVTGIAAFAVMSASLVPIALSMSIIGALNWSGIAKGLVGLAGAMTVVVVAMDSASGGLAGAAAMLIIAPALLALATAMSIMGAMGWGAILKSIVAMAGGMTILALALTGMDAALPGAAAMLVVAPGLLALAAALRVMGALSWSAIAKGMVALAGSLTILALGLTGMIIALPGALALTVAAKGLAVLALVLTGLGALSWSTILKGLAALAAVFLVVGVAGALLAPIVLPLMGLGAALVLIGAGFALAGAGALAFATAFGIFVGAGTAGIALVGNYMKLLVGNIPALLKSIGEGLVAFVSAVAANAPKMIAALARILVQLSEAVVKAAPKMGAAFTAMMQTGLRVLVSNAPKMASAGLRVIISFLSAVKSRIGQITGLAIDIVLKFIGEIGKKLPAIADAGAKLIIRFVNAVSSAIDNNSKAMGRAGGRLGMSIARGMITGMSGMVGEVVHEAAHLAQQALAAIHIHIGNPPFPSREGIKLGVSLATGFGYGISSAQDTAEKAAAGVAHGAMDTLRVTLQKASDHVSNVMDVNPTITPVLDLSKLTQDANQVSSLIGSSKLQAGVSIKSATTISHDRLAADEAAAQPAGGVTEVKFEQNNYSPKALPPIEIYRNTKNQLSKAKEALT